MKRWVQTAAAFGLGAVVGTLGDQIHVRAGVLRYRTPHRGAFGQPYWVPLLMGAAAVAMIEGYHTVRARGRGAEPPSDLDPIAREAASFFALYLASGVLRRYPRSLAVGFTGFFVWRVVREGDDLESVLHAVGTALAGTAFEHWLSGTEAFSYDEAHQHVGRTPLWLPGLYLQAARFARAVARAMPAAAPHA